MVNSSKVYVIDPKTGKSRRGSTRGSEKVEYRPEAQGGPLPDPGAGRGASSRKAESTRIRGNDSAGLSLLSYLLGPLALLATRQGGKSKVRIVIALASGVLSVVSIWMWGPIFSGPATGSFVDGVWILMGVAAIFTAFTAWSNAILLLSNERAGALRRLPDLIKKPFAAGLLGLLVPGLGLYVTGRGRRAAFALWMSGLAALSALVLSKAIWLWQWNEAAGGTAIDPQTLENVFIISAVAGVLGLFTYIVQALDGARLAGSRAAQRIPVRGDALAGMLLAAIVIFGFSFEPALVARNLDEFAVAAYGEGFKIIPLHAAKGAAALDPSRPVYVLHAASIYEDLGMDGEARALRLMLWNRWEPCVGAFEAEGRLTRTGVAADAQDVAESADETAAPLVVIENEKRGRLTIWDRIDALCGASRIENLSAAAGTP